MLACESITISIQPVPFESFNHTAIIDHLEYWICIFPNPRSDQITHLTGHKLTILQVKKHPIFNEKQNITQIEIIY